MRLESEKNAKNTVDVLYQPFVLRLFAKAVSQSRLNSPYPKEALYLG